MTKEELKDIPKLFIQLGLCKRKDPVIDKFYLAVIKALQSHTQEIVKIVEGMELEERMGDFKDGKSWHFYHNQALKEVVNKIKGL